MNSILFVPSVKKGNGSGHLVRCLLLAGTVGGKASVYLADNPAQEERSRVEIELAYPRETSEVRIRGHIEPGERFDLVVLDRRETALDEYTRWATCGPVLAIDEGGPARKSADYLVDILPVLPGSAMSRHTPNMASSGFMSLPVRRRDPPTSIDRVLVSFGGEDRKGLTGAFLSLATGKGFLKPSQITVVSGPLADLDLSYPGVTAIGPVQNLGERLASFDLVVTLFGLTAFEAAWAGCCVLLLNPSAVHERLARAAGFVSLGTGKPDAARLADALSSVQDLARRSATASPRSREDLPAFILSLEPRFAGPCPVCGRAAGTAIYRSTARTFLRCDGCGLVRQVLFSGRTSDYTQPAYFFDEYKAQYGRTYIEDIPTIRKAAARRLAIIESLTPDWSAGHRGPVSKAANTVSAAEADRRGTPGTSGGQDTNGIQDGQGTKNRQGSRETSSARKPGILDIGCAYGAFVAEAKDRGWQAIACDVSADAVSYTAKTFGVNSFVADFSAPDSGTYPDNLDCVSLWYVIEHFPEAGAVMKRVASLLKPGGVFAFSTPSCSGISARRNLHRFLERSPDDHCTVWSPSSVSSILARYGFKVRRIVVTGHHPERFPFVPDNPRSVRYRLAMLVSRLAGLGDTFECYATLGERDNRSAPSMESQ